MCFSFFSISFYNLWFICLFSDCLHIWRFVWLPFFFIINYLSPMDSLSMSRQWKRYYAKFVWACGHPSWRADPYQELGGNDGVPVEGWGSGSWYFGQIRSIQIQNSFLIELFVKYYTEARLFQKYVCLFPEMLIFYSYFSRFLSRMLSPDHKS